MALKELATVGIPSNCRAGIGYIAEDIGLLDCADWVHVQRSTVCDGVTHLSYAPQVLMAVSTTCLTAAADMLTAAPAWACACAAAALTCSRQQHIEQGVLEQQKQVQHRQLVPRAPMPACKQVQHVYGLIGTKQGYRYVRSSFYVAIAGFDAGACMLTG
jgi:uridine phosphorylase